MYGERHNRPFKRYNHREHTTDGEFTNVFSHLEKVFLGPFRFFYDETNDWLHLQVIDRENSNEYQTIQIWKGMSTTRGTSGDTVIYGNPTTAAGSSITNVGRM